MSRILIPVLACLFGGAATLAALPVTASDYDLDCAVILCLAAGFPVEPSGTCAEAFEQMIDRVHRRAAEAARRRLPNQRRVRVRAHAGPVLPAVATIAFGVDLPGPQPDAVLRDG